MKKKNIAKKSNESLQKFTDFENIKQNQIEEFIDKFRGKTATEKTVLSEYIHWLQDKLHSVIGRETPKDDGELDKYYNRFIKLMEVLYSDNPDAIERQKNQRWEINESRIKQFLHNTMVTKRYLPRSSEIAEATGLSRVTISKHIKENDLSIYKQEERDKYKMLNSSALNQLYYLAFNNGDVRALKMFIELTKEQGGSSQVVNNNFIQINNTKIDNLLIEQLPVKTRLQIEKIILKNIPTKKE